MESQANRRGYVIDVDKTWHVAWWAEKFGVSIQALLDAVSLVGNDSGAVQQWLGIHRHTSSIIEQLTQPTPPTVQSVDGRPNA
jgi:predicted 3-demethylubiquinone-9 3-methyltransferase (glyoxalase superfamily)